MGSKGGDVVVGYSYHFGIHMGICRGPVDELVEIKVGDRIAWPFAERENPPHPLWGRKGPEWSREFPGNVRVYQVAPQVPENPALSWYAMLLVETPGTFLIGQPVTITGWTRNGNTVDGTYPIINRSDGTYDEAASTPASITLDIGTDPDVLAAWQHFNTVDGDPTNDYGQPFTMSVPETDDGSDPTYSEKATQSCVIYIDAPDLFGGKKQEGGIQGPMNVMMGEPTQVAPEGLVNMLGGPLPGFRGVFTAFFDGLIAALNPYPKPWKFRVRRALKGWDGDTWQPDLAIIDLSRDLADGEVSASNEIKAMNAAHIIYECLTNRVWGRGLPRSKIDEDAFLLAATTLKDEGFGLCLRWNRRDTIQAFVQSVLDHIGAALFENRSTAKLSLKLIRAVPDVSTLPLFEPGAGLLTVREAGVAASSGYINEVKVTYRDPISDEERMVKVDNLANLQANNGASNSITRNYPGIPTAPLALRVAQRDLRSQGLELRRYSLVLDRRAWNLTPGDAIRIRDHTRGIKETVVRLGRFEDGTGTNGEITVSAVQDVFALPTTSYVEPQPVVAPPVLDPCVGEFEVFEVPYALIAGSVSAADFAAIGQEACFLGVVMDRGRLHNTNYLIATRSGNPDPLDWPLDDDSYCGYQALEFALGVDDPDLFTGWSMNWPEVRDLFIDKYNVKHAITGPWIEDGPDYTSFDLVGLPIQIRLRSSEEVPVPIKKWRWSGHGIEDTANHFDSLIAAASSLQAWYVATAYKTVDGEPRDARPVSITVVSVEPDSSGPASNPNYQVAVVHITNERLYGYPGDSDEPGYYPATHEEFFYEFKAGESTESVPLYSDVYDYERRIKE